MMAQGSELRTQGNGAEEGKTKDKSKKTKV